MLDLISLAKSAGFFGKIKKSAASIVLRLKGFCRYSVLCFLQKTGYTISYARFVVNSVIISVTLFAGASVLKPLLLKCVKTA